MAADADLGAVTRALAGEPGGGHGAQAANAALARLEAFLFDPASPATKVQGAWSQLLRAASSAGCAAPSGEPKQLSLAIAVWRLLGRACTLPKDRSSLDAVSACRACTAYASAFSEGPTAGEEYRQRGKMCAFFFVRGANFLSSLGAPVEAFLPLFTALFRAMARARGAMAAAAAAEADRSFARSFLWPKLLLAGDKALDAAALSSLLPRIAGEMRSASAPLPEESRSLWALLAVRLLGRPPAKGGAALPASLLLPEVEALLARLPKGRLEAPELEAAARAADLWPGRVQTSADLLFLQAQALRLSLSQSACERLFGARLAGAMLRAPGAPAEKLLRAWGGAMRQLAGAGAGAEAALAVGALSRILEGSGFCAGAQEAVIAGSALLATGRVDIEGAAHGAGAPGGRFGAAVLGPWVEALSAVLGARRNGAAVSAAQRLELQVYSAAACAEAARPLLRDAVRADARCAAMAAVFLREWKEHGDDMHGPYEAVFRAFVHVVDLLPQHGAAESWRATIATVARGDGACGACAAAAAVYLNVARLESAAVAAEAAACKGRHWLVSSAPPPAALAGGGAGTAADPLEPL